MLRSSLIATLSSLALSTSWGEIGVSSRAQLEAMWGKSTGYSRMNNNGQALSYLRKDGRPLIVGYDDKGVEQVIMYMNVSGNYFTPDKCKEFDWESLPSGNLNWQRMPDKMLGPLGPIDGSTTAVDASGWITQSKDGVMYVMDAKYNWRGLIVAVRLYATEPGGRMMDELMADPGEPQKQ